MSCRLRNGGREVVMGAGTNVFLNEWNDDSADWSSGNQYSSGDGFCLNFPLSVGKIG